MTRTGWQLSRPRRNATGEESALGFVWFIVVGFVAGLLAGLIMKCSGYGILGDIVVGVLGVRCGAARSTFTDSTCMRNFPGFLSLSMKPNPLIWSGPTGPMP